MSELYNNMIHLILKIIDEEDIKYSERFFDDLEHVKYEVGNWIENQIKKEKENQPEIKRYLQLIPYVNEQLLRADLNFEEGMRIFQNIIREGNWLLEGKYGLFMSRRLSNLLQIFYDFYPERYITLCNQEKNAFWLFPILDEVRKENPSKSPFLHIGKLNPSLKGICAGFVWNHFIQNNKDNTVFCLNNVKIALSRNELWIFLGKVIENLLLKVFPSMSFVRNNHDIKMKKEILYQIISWIIEELGKEKWGREEIQSYFLQSLSGTVNRESWLGALLIANKLEEIGQDQTKENALLLREEVIDQYPHLWDKGHSKQYFFSGEQTLVLVDELVNAFYKIFQETSVSNLEKIGKISSPQKLWYLRDVHQYSDYLAERKLTTVHYLLCVKLALKIKRKDRNGSWKQLENNILQLCKQFDASPTNGSEELIFHELIADFGELWQECQGEKQIIARLIQNLPDAESAVFLFKHLSLENKDQFRSLLRNKIVKYFEELRDKRKMSLAKVLYSIQEWKLCIWVLDRLNCKNNHNELSLYYQLYVSSALLLIPTLNEEQRIRLLQKALSVLDRYRTQFPYVYEELYFVMRGYVVGLLFDLGQIDEAVFFHEYYAIKQIRAEKRKESLSKVKAEMFIRAVDMTDKEEDIEELEKYLSEIENSEEMKDMHILMKAWVYGKRRNEKMKRDCLEKLTQFKEQLVKNKEVIPKPLQRLLREAYGAN
jgi:hypothetical protein